MQSKRIEWLSEQTKQYQWIICLQNQLSLYQELFLITSSITQLPILLSTYLQWALVIFRFLIYLFPTGNNVFLQIISTSTFKEATTVLIIQKYSNIDYVRGRLSITVAMKFIKAKLSYYRFRPFLNTNKQKTRWRQSSGPKRVTLISFVNRTRFQLYTVQQSNLSEQIEDVPLDELW